MNVQESMRLVLSSLILLALGGAFVHLSSKLREEGRVRVEIHLTRPQARTGAHLPVEIRLVNEGSKSVVVKSSGTVGYAFRWIVTREDGTLVPFPPGMLCCDTDSDPKMDDFEVLKPGERSGLLHSCWMISGFPTPGRLRIQVTYRRLDPELPGFFGRLWNPSSHPGPDRLMEEAFRGELTAEFELEVVR